MADRTPGGAPEEGTPEYDWLYGSGASSRPGDEVTQAMPTRPPAPPETRVLPVTPSAAAPAPASKPGPPRSTRSTRVTPPPIAPPPTPSRGRGRRLRFRHLIALLVLWLAFLVAVPIFAMNKLHRIDAWPTGDRPADQPGTTYLLVGSDSRADLSAAERKELHTGGDVGQRTDTIMLLHTGGGPNLLMSIPRDSIVDIPDHGTTKINAAYAYGGAPLLVETIEHNTGIRIDNYVEIGFGGFVDLVDAVGGISICPKDDMVDADANLNIKKGCQEVDGTVALAYARSRHAQELGDLDRARHQREVVAAIGKKAVSPWSVVNPLRYWRLNMSATRAFAADSDMSTLSLAKFAMAMTKVNGSSGMTCGVPISDLAVNWDPERSQEMFKHIIEDDTAAIGKRLCTPSGLAP